MDLACCRTRVEHSRRGTGGKKSHGKESEEKQAADDHFEIAQFHMHYQRGMQLELYGPGLSGAA